MCLEKVVWSPFRNCQPVGVDRHPGSATFHWATRGRKRVMGLRLVGRQIRRLRQEADVILQRARDHDGGLGHLRIEAEAVKILALHLHSLDDVIHTSQFLRHKGDRPQVVPSGSNNLAFIGQFCELPDDVVFTVEILDSALHKRQSTLCLISSANRRLSTKESSIRASSTRRSWPCTTSPRDGQALRDDPRQGASFSGAYFLPARVLRIARSPSRRSNSLLETP